MVSTVKRTAKFSPDRKHRYMLSIIWDESRSVVNFLMLNPSTADEFKNDPTVERCMRRAKMWGYGGVIVTNIFAFRSTNPKALYSLDEYEAKGRENNKAICDAAEISEATIAGWGQHGKLHGRQEDVMGLFKDIGIPLYYLKLSKNGTPYHPLYVPYSCTPELLVL